MVVFVNAPPYALLCGWLAWRGRIRALAPLVVGAAWLAVEWLRAHGPVPNPYALLAMSQLGTPFAQSADALGGFGVGAVVAVGNATLAALVAPGLRGTRPTRDLALAVVVVLAAFVYGSWRHALSYGEGEPLHVAVIQPAAAANAGPERDGRSLDQLLALTRSVSDDEPLLVFWPESAVDFYLREAGDERERVLAATRSSSAELVLGGPHYRYAEPAPDYFASVFLVRGGGIVGRYDKRRLIPFAEYNPLAPWLPASAAQLQPGETSRPLQARSASIGAFLCGEVLFPDVARRLSLAGATLLANPSSDGWFGAEAPARHQLQAAALRAIENRRPLVRATKGGYSAILDAYGELVASSVPGVATLLEARVRPSAVATPYQQLGYALAPCAVGLVVASSAWRRRRSESGGI
jgi:apolipoprotein N-acyltransferase